jgi:hypothetical protein
MDSFRCCIFSLLFVFLGFSKEKGCHAQAETHERAPGQHHQQQIIKKIRNNKKLKKYKHNLQKRTRGPLGNIPNKIAPKKLVNTARKLGKRVKKVRERGWLEVQDEDQDDD